MKNAREQVRQAKAEIRDIRNGNAACRATIAAHRAAAELMAEPARSFELGKIETSLTWLELFGNSLDAIETRLDERLSSEDSVQTDPTLRLREGFMGWKLTLDRVSELLPQARAIAVDIPEPLRAGVAKLLDAVEGARDAMAAEMESHAAVIEEVETMHEFFTNAKGTLSELGEQMRELKRGQDEQNGPSF